MAALLDHFKMGGWGMFPTLVFGILMLYAAVKYALGPKRSLVPLLFGLGILTLASGALGFVSGVIASINCLDKVAPPDRSIILTYGVGESLNNVGFALLRGPRRDRRRGRRVSNREARRASRHLIKSPSSRRPRDGTN